MMGSRAVISARSTFGRHDGARCCCRWTMLLLDNYRIILIMLKTHATY
jgi:hypothetical protein